MFKSKEKRDTALLIFMAVVTVIFLAYLFVPWGERSRNDVNGDLSNSEIGIEGTTNSGHNADGNDSDRFADFNHRLQRELAAIYQTITTSRVPFNEYQISALTGVIESFALQNRERGESGKLATILMKSKKMSFSDLGELARFIFPESFVNRYRFNLYLSFLLIKARQEDINRLTKEYSDVQFQELLDFSPYRLIGNEIEKDFQSIPAVLYFYLLVNRLDVYPLVDEAGYFYQKIEKIRDLSTAKNLKKIKEFLHFSTEPQSFRIEWIEADEFDPDDREVYQNLNLNRFKFLKQRYLVFPDPLAENNRWIRELIAADSGDIELADLRIISENPLEKIQLEKIFYSSISSSFVVLLDSLEEGDSLLDIIVSDRIAYCSRNFTVISFDEEAMKQESWPDQLRQFGNYLKKISF